LFEFSVNDILIASGSFIRGLADYETRAYPTYAAAAKVTNWSQSPSWCPIVYPLNTVNYLTNSLKQWILI